MVAHHAAVALELAQRPAMLPLDAPRAELYPAQHGVVGVLDDALGAVRAVDHAAQVVLRTSEECVIRRGSFECCSILNAAHLIGTPRGVLSTINVTARFPKFVEAFSVFADISAKISRVVEDR